MEKPASVEGPPWHWGWRWWETDADWSLSLFHLCPAHLQLLGWLNHSDFCLKTKCRANSLIWIAPPPPPTINPMINPLLCIMLSVSASLLNPDWFRFSPRNYSPFLINDFRKPAGTVLFCTESLKMCILCHYLNINIKIWLNHLEKSLLVSQMLVNYFFFWGKVISWMEVTEMVVVYIDSVTLIIRFL